MAESITDVSDTLVELFHNYQLSAEALEQQITEEVLDKIASTCCEDYRRLPPYLGVECIAIRDIERDGKSEPERRQTFLRKWKQVKGSGATYKAIIAALLKIRCREDAEKICVLVKSLKPLRNTPAMSTSICHSYSWGNVIEVEY